MISFSDRPATNFDEGPNEVRAAATFLKFAALGSAIATSALAALILGWQAASWILTGKSSSLSVSRVLAKAALERESTYMIASASERSYSFGFQTISDWFLDLPTAGFLLAVAAILVSFSVFGASVEKQWTERID
jgi:hypothetical protein